ncbi:MULTISPECIES: fimbrillin family protein [Bacteroidaceae]|jgi:hypothetical protein|uniref:fimbrillin family protein n=1 Tax=Bacteroidaceae TaxID=815 RepID=UPI00258C32BF|nr:MULTISPECIES: fimbrillin family protein [Bacteroidaceae]
MKGNKQSILMVAALLLLAGCSNDNEGAATPEGDGRVALEVSSGIESRAYDNKWESDDAIGIYMLKTGTATISEGAENRRYFTADGGSAFTATTEQTIYFPLDGSKVDFIAYYPYQKNLTNGAFTLDISTQTDLSAIDLMTAGTKTTEAEPLDKNHYKVHFKFAHRLTKLELNIGTGRGITTEDLKGLKVEVTKQRTSGSYDPQFETFGVDSEPVQTVELNTNAGGTLAQAILLPTTAADGINPIVTRREFLFTLKSTGEVFRWSVPDDKSFERGDKNIYNITINRSGVEVTATIEKWNEVDNGEIEAE